MIVSPNYSRKAFIRLIKAEIRNRNAGKNAWILLKINNLVDQEIIEILYQASNAGVKIKLIIRGMFSLVPGQKGFSENIEAISIVDKLLEHSRIFAFCNDDDPVYYLSSADWMPRNLDHRVEVTCPVYDPDLKLQIQKFLDIQWQDNCRARILNPLLDNKMRRAGRGKKIRAQWDIYEWLKNASC